MKIKLPKIVIFISLLQLFVGSTMAAKGETMLVADDSNGISGTLPVMYINVYKDDSHTQLEDEIIDTELAHKNYFNHAEYWLDMNGCEWLIDLGCESIGTADTPLPLQIKARGNWSRIGFAKKPFKIKLDKKQNLLGLTPKKSKHYALLSHADDNKGYLRNFVTFNLGERIGLPWTPKQQPLELVINGDYRGLYFLTESIRVGDGRIDIAELDDNESEGSLISGGYVVELDNYVEENQITIPEKLFVEGQKAYPIRITFNTPEEYSEIQRTFITDQFNAINDAVGTNDDVMWRYLDLDDAVRYYLVWEIVSNYEAFHGSTYLFRDRGEGEKWHFSPLWDAGNAFRNYTNKFFYDCDPYGNTWIPSIRENSMFNNKLYATWKWFMQNCYEGLADDMDVYSSRIKAAAVCDHQRWKDVPPPAEVGIPVEDNSNMEARLAFVKNHLSEKIEWLKTQFGDYYSGDFQEPERDDTPPMPLPGYAGIGSIDAECDDDAPTIYYNLQGLKVENPLPGQLYIVKKGSKSSKIIFR